MKYRIKKRKNFITGETRYAVEQQIYEGDKGWMLSQYTDENEERKFAIFDTIADAKLLFATGMWSMKKPYGRVRHE